MEAPGRAFRAALPMTLPIFAGFTFLGTAYGILMRSSGFSFLYPVLMSLTIFAGSMEFVTVNLLMEAFDPLHAFLMTLMVNARHLFYGISMLEKYRGTGLKKFYLIFGMCDESFSINCSAKIPEGVDKGWYMFFVTLLNHAYWVLGATLGAVLGEFITWNTKGLDFVMTALFLVIFLNQWEQRKGHLPAVIGVVVSVICLIVFGPDQFILPSMALILAVLTMCRRRLETEAGKAAAGTEDAEREGGEPG